MGSYQNEVRGAEGGENSAHSMNSRSVINRIADMKNNRLNAAVSGAPINHVNAETLRLFRMVSDLVSCQVFQSAYA